MRSGLFFNFINYCLNLLHWRISACQHGLGGENRKAAEKRALELLQLLDLTDRSDHKPSELSGGEKQRVAVARSLINNPSVVFADEPSGSLDSHNREELFKLFFQLRERIGQTFVIVTHDETFAHHSDRELRIKDGVIVDEISHLYAKSN